MLEHINLLIWILPHQQVYLPEHLEGVDNGENGDKEHGGGEVAQFDIEELVGRGGALHVGHFQQFLGNVVQGRHKKNQVIAQVLPQEQDDDYDLGVLAFQPVDLLRAKDGQHLV